MDIEVVVEIPQGSRNKYEMDHASGRIRLDRMLFTSTRYPADYGFVTGMLAEDGDPLDVLILLGEPTFPRCEIIARPVGVFWMSDEHGPDAKILAVPAHDPRYADVGDLAAAPDYLLAEISHFFDVYKELEPGKDTDVRGWQGREAPSRRSTRPPPAAAVGPSPAATSSGLVAWPLAERLDDADGKGTAMRPSADDDPLVLALDELAQLAGEADRARLAEGRARLAAQRLRVLVAGEAKRGKSTLINALLGRPLLPMGVTPLTALATTVRQGTAEQVTARYRDGREECRPLPALEDLVTERRNPGNRHGLASVTVAVDAPVLARGAELVDTPGSGSIYGHNTIEAEAALDTMDAAIFVLTADPPVSASERDLLARVAGRSVTTFVVLNKADYLDGYEGDTVPPGSELAEALAFTEQVAGEAAGGPLRVYPLSARAALGSGQDRGFTAFAADFTSYLDHGRADDVRLSLAAQARRIAQALHDEALLAGHAAQLRSDADADRVAAFRARLAAVAERKQDAADLVRGESARLLATLNDDAAGKARDCRAAIGSQLENLLTGQLWASPPAEIERAGRAALVKLAIDAAQAWRQGEADRLERALDRLSGRLGVQLQAELDTVREAAAELLGLDLSVPAPAGRLVPDLRFFYPVAEEAGQTELLAGVIRRHLPGAVGGRRARAHLHREAAELVPRLIGRARADLQYRLAEATRRMARSIETQYADSTERLEEALRTADVLRTATAEEATRRDGELALRLATLDRLLAWLAGTGDHVPAG